MLVAEPFGTWTRVTAWPQRGFWHPSGRKPKLRVPAILLRAWAKSLLCVLWMAPVDRALAGAGLFIAASSAAFATGMILRAGSARATFVQPQGPAGSEHSTISYKRGATDGFSPERIGSIAQSGIDAGAMRPQRARSPIVKPDERSHRSGHRVSSYVLRYADVGAALVQGPSGTLVVVPGSLVPDAGSVHSIENRAGHWVIVTAGGTIEEPEM